MPKQTPLFLHEEIMLLALRDQKGTVGSSIHLQQTIAGAVAAELLLSGRISVEDTKKKLVNLVSAKPFGDGMLDECLAKVESAKRRASLRTWVSRFSGLKNVKGRVAERLCQRGILRIDEDKVLLLFTRKIYPEVDPRPEKALVERLRKAIFTNTREIEPRTVVLLSLAHSTYVLKEVFEKKRLKERKKRIEQLVNGDLAGKATKEAIQAMQAAVMVAVIMPAIVVSAR